jgi:hypothetical protein
MEKNTGRQQGKRSQEREKATISKIAEASRQVTAIFQLRCGAASSTGHPKRTEDHVQKAVSQRITEIFSAGKTEHAEGRFQYRIKRIEATSLPKKKATLQCRSS